MRVAGHSIRGVVRLGSDFEGLVVISTAQEDELLERNYKKKRHMEKSLVFPVHVSAFHSYADTTRFLALCKYVDLRSRGTTITTAMMPCPVS